MKRINLTLILCACLNLLYAQNSLLKKWDNRFGGTREDFIYSFQQTSDGGYILGGGSSSDSTGDKTQNSRGTYDYWIVKIDSLGQKQWDKDYGGTGSDILFSMQQTKDGGYILGGSSNSNISGDKTQQNWDSVNFTYDYWVIKIDSGGAIQWDKDFGGTKTDLLTSLQQTTDGGYILGGYSLSDSSGNKTMHSFGSYDYWIVKIDASGNYQWDKSFGGADDDELTSLDQTADGGYILGGTSISGINGNKTEPPKGNYDYWIIKVDSQGVEKWQKDLGGDQDDILYSLKQTREDKGYVLAGTSSTGINGDKTQPNWDTSNATHDYWLVKTDSSGTIQWDKDFGGTDIEEKLGAVSQTSDGGYLLEGSSYSGISGNKTEDNLGREQTWVVKTDKQGKKEWDKTIFTDAEDESGFGVQTKDGCYAITCSTTADVEGYVTQPARGFHDYWIVKLCDTSLTTATIKAIASAPELSIYPNPCTSEITVAVKIPKPAFVSYTIYDVLGQPVFRESESKLNNASAKKISIYNLQPGIYFLSVTIDGAQTIKKIVKE